jgi:hypothetical protein
MAVIHPRIKTGFARLQERWADRLLTTLTVMLAAILFVLAPLHGADVIKSESYSVVILLLCGAGLFVVSGSPVTVVSVLVAIGLSAAAATLRLRHSSLDLYLDATAWTILGISVSWAVARAVFGPGVVNYHRIIGAILLYLLIGSTFVAFYTFVGLIIPDAFAGVPMEDSPALVSNLIYFSFVTLTSTGYGDIVPVHPIARSLSNIEGIIGQLYPATLLARLVSLEIESRRK